MPVCRYLISEQFQQTIRTEIAMPPKLRNKSPAVPSLSRGSLFNSTNVPDNESEIVNYIAHPFEEKFAEFKGRYFDGN